MRNSVLKDKVVRKYDKNSFKINLGYAKMKAVLTTIKHSFWPFSLNISTDLTTQLSATVCAAPSKFHFIFFKF